MDDYLSTRAQTASRPLSLRTIAAAALAAFLLGAAGIWYFAGAPQSLGGLFKLTSDDPASVPRATLASPSAATAAPALGAGDTVAEVAGQQGGLDQRVAAMEQRLARLDLQAQAAAGNAARAEGLLVAFAARRAIERGAPLGYLADQLRMRFGDARPNAVRTVIAAAQDPITLDRLVARLDGLEPELAQAPQSEGPVDWLARQLGALFVIRREDAPSPAPERRIERARLFLESGRTAAAVSEVRMLPNAAAAREWIADAERYADAQQALELLETAAILEPRELRDGDGERVAQPDAAR